MIKHLKFQINSFRNKKRIVLFFPESQDVFNIHQLK